MVMTYLPALGPCVMVSFGASLVRPSFVRTSTSFSGSTADIFRCMKVAEAQILKRIDENDEMVRALTIESERTEAIVCILDHSGPPARELIEPLDQIMNMSAAMYCDNESVIVRNRAGEKAPPVCCMIVVDVVVRSSSIILCSQGQDPLLSKSQVDALDEVSLR